MTANGQNPTDPAETFTVTMDTLLDIWASASVSAFRTACEFPGAPNDDSLKDAREMTESIFALHDQAIRDTIRRALAARSDEATDDGDVE